MQLYKMLCPSVGLLVHWRVGPSWWSSWIVRKRATLMLPIYDYLCAWVLLGWTTTGVWFSSPSPKTSNISPFYTQLYSIYTPALITHKNTLKLKEQTDRLWTRLKYDLHWDASFAFFLATELFIARTKEKTRLSAPRLIKILWMNVFDEWMNKWMNEWTNERTNERMNRWMSKWMKMNVVRHEMW